MRVLVLWVGVAAAGPLSCDRGGNDDADGTATGAAGSEDGGACYYVRRSSVTCSDAPSVPSETEDECVETIDKEGCEDRVDEKSYVDCEFDCCFRSSASNSLYVAGNTCRDPRPSGGGGDDGDGGLDTGGGETSGGESADSGGETSVGETISGGSSGAESADSGETTDGATTTGDSSGEDSADSGPASTGMTTEPTAGG